MKCWLIEEGLFVEGLVRWLLLGRVDWDRLREMLLSKGLRRRS
jgi:hypothetical protein